MALAPFTLTPAYGRDYKSRAGVVADLNAGKDFVVNSISPSGRYTRLPEIVKMHPEVTELKVRYEKLRKVIVVKVNTGVAS